MEEQREINRLTRVSYDLAATKYDELFRDELDRKPYDRQLLDEFAGHFTPGAIIHDLGCGPSGHIGHYLHAKGLRVIGSDLSQRCVDIASACHPEMEFLVMDMASLTLEDQTIDGVLSYYSIIHTPKKLVPRLFREFHRVLKKKGKLLLSVKEGDQEGFLEEFLGFETRIYFTHFHEEEIARLLTGNGFEVLFLEKRSPLEDEISVPRIFAIGEKR
jgi:ubiquinone/menaquinone biosynthesis C-methylase UbiE